MVAPTVENIGVAVVDQFTSCSNADLTYSTIASTSLFSGSLLNYEEPDPLGGYSGGFVTVSAFDICISNQVTAPGPVSVVVSTENEVSNEVEGCPDPVEAAAGDTSCGPGEGELLGIDVVGIGLGPESGGCNPISIWIPGGPVVNSVDTFGPLAPGSICRFGVNLGWFPYNDVVSSDTISFDLVFTADDGT
jgi:hypothetical protein